MTGRYSAIKETETAQAIASIIGSPVTLEVLGPGDDLPSILAETWSTALAQH